MIYFEGTYTKMFSRDDPGTPRYEYNQIMYRLDLDDPRLAVARHPRSKNAVTASPTRTSLLSSAPRMAAVPFE